MPGRAPVVRFALAALAILLMASCSGPASASPSAASPPPSASSGGSGGTSIDVTLKEFSIAVSQEASAGEVSFQVKNEGTMTHEFDIYQSSLPLDGLPINSSQMVDEGSAMVKIIEVSAPIPAGTSLTVVATLAPGTYYLVCNQAGHYKLGMRLAYVVT